MLIRFRYCEYSVGKKWDFYEVDVFDLCESEFYEMEDRMDCLVMEG